MTESTQNDVVDFAEFDVLAQNQERGTELKIRHPTKGHFLGASLLVVSYESKRVQDCIRTLGERRVREGRRVTSQEEQDEENIEIQATAVVGFVVPPRVDGADLMFSHENVKTWLRRFKWVRPQIENHGGSLSAFLPS